MCDVTDYALGAILGQKVDKIFKPIYYASRTLDEHQVNYTTTEKKMLEVVFSLENFRSYTLGSYNIVHNVTQF